MELQSFSYVCSSQSDELKKRVITGAKIKTVRFATLGKIVSFNNNFKTSAKGCSKPKNPTTFGPFLRCIDAITLRSIRVR